MSYNCQQFQVGSYEPWESLRRWEHKVSSGEMPPPPLPPVKEEARAALLDAVRNRGRNREIGVRNRGQTPLPPRQA